LFASTRLWDLIAVVVVAVVLLLPKPSVEAHPAVDGDRVELDRLSLLEDAYTVTTDLEHALALADIYEQLRHPDWALAVLQPYEDHWRLHMLRATAWADLLDPKRAVEEVKLAEQGCERAQCGEHNMIRLGVIKNSMQALLDANIDVAKDPLKARQAVEKILHTTKASPKK
jgi:hypothetical protein